MRRVEDQSDDVFRERAAAERIKAGGRDSEGEEAECNCGVSWKRSVEPHILSA